MFAFFTAPDALIVVAIISTFGATVAGWVAARKARQQSEANARQLIPNGGKSARDVLDRLEHSLQHEVIPRLDRAAAVSAEHADRLAALEARNKATRTRTGDK